MKRDKNLDNKEDKLQFNDQFVNSSSQYNQIISQNSYVDSENSKMCLDPPPNILKSNTQNTSNNLNIQSIQNESNKPIDIDEIKVENLEK